MDKKHLGQFYTKKYNYILKDFELPEIKHVIEPFAGECDLIKYIESKKQNIQLECYDIDPKTKFTIKRDTLLKPPSYKNKFVITNPPYLARNKNKDKSLYDKYKVNDLYKIFILNLINDNPDSGIIIIPLNFWSSIRKSDISIRINFLKKFKIVRMNIFEEQVFDDTTYTICSFLFRKKNNSDDDDINTYIYPSNKNISLKLTNGIIGGEIYQIKNTTKYTISRMTSKNKNKKSSKILLKCIDDNKDSMINCSISDVYIDNTPNLSARTYATLLIEPYIELDKQKIIVDKFNNILNNYRSKYNSLFLTNYRESKDIARKRISFDLAYKIISQAILELEF